MNNRDMFEAIHQKVGKVWLGCVAIHFLFLLGVAVTGNWHTVFNPTPTFAVLLWVVLNDISAVFATVFAAACFNRESLFGKIVFYPIGALIMITVLLTLSFPFLILGIFGGAIAHVMFLPGRTHSSC